MSILLDIFVTVVGTVIATIITVPITFWLSQRLQDRANRQTQNLEDDQFSAGANLPSSKTGFFRNLWGEAKIGRAFEKLLMEQAKARSALIENYGAQLSIGLKTYYKQADKNLSLDPQIPEMDDFLESVPNELNPFEILNLYSKHVFEYVSADADQKMKEIEMGWESLSSDIISTHYEDWDQLLLTQEQDRLEFIAQNNGKGISPIEFTQVVMGSIMFSLWAVLALVTWLS